MDDRNVDEGKVPSEAQAASGVKLTPETRLVLMAFLFSGAAALIYEVTWTRTLSLVLGSTVYALSTMLSTFMAGLALGAWLGGRLSDRGGDLLKYFSFCELGIGISGMLSIPFIYAVPRFYLHLYEQFHSSPNVFFIIQLLICIAIMIVPTTLMGLTFPLVSKRITTSLTEMGRKVGDAYSFNTVGAVLGSLAVGFLLIPHLGIKGATFVAAGLNLIIGLGMIILARSEKKGAIAVLLSLFAISGVVLASMPASASILNFYSARSSLEAGRAEYYLNPQKGGLVTLMEKEYPDGTVRAYRSAADNLLIQAGGKIEGVFTEGYPHAILLSFLPIALHSNPKSALDIGLGAGITLQTAKRHLSDVTLVEIHPGVVDAVEQFGPEDIFEGVDVIIDDGRNYLFKTGKTFDIIISDTSYPTEYGTSALFTREFYEIAARKLNPGGIFTQSFPYYMLSTDDITMLLKTLNQVFPNIYLWKTPLSNDLIAVASMDPFNATPKEVKYNVQELNKPNHPLMFTISKTPEEVRDIVRMKGIPLNTDDRPLLEFRAVHNLLSGTPVRQN